VAVALEQGQHLHRCIGELPGDHSPERSHPLKQSGSALQLNMLGVDELPSFLAPQEMELQLFGG
jgi:hypothetical protein